MSFADDVTRFNVKVEEHLVPAIFDGSVAESFRSIVEGSEITGAPGQPVAPGGVPNAGKLRDSWTVERPSDTEAVISTDVDYASDVEDNIKSADFANHGPHSVKLTVAGWPRIVEHVAQKVTGNG